MIGKTAVVVGGARGIGFRIATELSTLGADVIVTGTNMGDCTDFKGKNIRFNFQS